jgi:hypothetical protein
VATAFDGTVAGASQLRACQLRVEVTLSTFSRRTEYDRLRGVSPQLRDWELIEFSASVRGQLGRVWSSPHRAGEPDVAELLKGLWRLAGEQGWTALAADDLLEGALAAMTELGRAACPLPLMDAYVAYRLLAGGGPADAVATAEVRPVVALGSGAEAEHVEAAAAATHVLVLPAGPGDAVRLYEVAQIFETPGVARPSWSKVRLGSLTVEVQAPPEAVKEAKALLRIGLVARAIGAARVAHELAVEHAKVRHAFGKRSVYSRPFRIGAPTPSRG